MRIAYVCADPGVPVFGCKGCSVHVQEVVQALRSHGAEVQLFAANCRGPRPAPLKTLTVRSLPCPDATDTEERERQAFKANGALQVALERHGPFDAIYERYSLWSYAALQYAQADGIPSLLEVNAPLVNEQKRRRVLYLENFARLVSEWIFNDATALLPVSDELANYLRQLGVDADRIHVISNGVNPDRFQGLSVARDRPLKNFHVGFLGTLKPWHDLITLTEAFAELHRQDASYRLLVVGSGPQQQAMIATLAPYGVAAVEAVHFVGAVSPADVPRWLSSMDVAVAPYADTEECYFSPLKVYEYMAAGLPVVASDIGQLGRVIQHGITGMLTPPGNAEALAGTIQLLREDQLLCRRLGNAARERVQRAHTWNAIAGRILDLANSLHSITARPRA